MVGSQEVDRRTVIRTTCALGAGGFLAGCSGDDGGGTPTNTPTPTPTDTPTPTETPTPEETPTPTEEPDEFPEIETVEDAVTLANEKIAMINEGGDTSIASYNEAFDDVEPMDPIEPVEASTPEEAADEADRLRSEIDRVEKDVVTKVVEEINAEAGFQFVSSGTDTAEEARTEADAVESSSQEAADVLRDAADFADMVEMELTTAADALESV